MCYLASLLRGTVLWANERGHAAPQDGVSLEELALIDADGLLDVLGLELSALREECERVFPYHRLDVAFADPLFSHERGGLGHLERIAHAPVGRAIDDDP